VSSATACVHSGPRRGAGLPGTVRRDDRGRGRLHAGVVRRLTGRRGVRSRERVLGRPEPRPGKVSVYRRYGPAAFCGVACLDAKLSYHQCCRWPPTPSAPDCESNQSRWGLACPWCCAWVLSCSRRGAARAL
jgi:hypothetical protein